MEQETKKKQIPSQEDLGELSLQERDLIDSLRNRFRWGEVIILVREGRPQRILKAYDSYGLGFDS